MSTERVSVSEEGEGHILCRGTENRKGAETNTGESGASNLEAESIRSSTGGCVKLKTITEIRRSSHQTHRVTSKRRTHKLMKKGTQHAELEKKKGHHCVVLRVSGPIHLHYLLYTLRGRQIGRSWC